jgi:hypothetical protein
VDRIEIAAKALFEHDWLGSVDQNKDAVWLMHRDLYLRKATAVIAALDDPAEVWDEAVEATVSWVEACGSSGPNGPPDPPPNPYRAGTIVPEGHYGLSADTDGSVRIYAAGEDASDLTAGKPYGDLRTQLAKTAEATDNEEERTQ